MVRLNYDILNGLCVDRSIGSDGEEHILEYIKKRLKISEFKRYGSVFPFALQFQKDRNYVLEKRLFFAARILAREILVP